MVDFYECSTWHWNLMRKAFYGNTLKKFPGKKALPGINMVAAEQFVIFSVIKQHLMFKH